MFKSFNNKTDKVGKEITGISLGSAMSVSIPMMTSTAISIVSENPSLFYIVLD